MTKSSGFWPSDVQASVLVLTRRLTAYSRCGNVWGIHCAIGYPFETAKFKTLTINKTWSRGYISCAINISHTKRSRGR